MQETIVRTEPLLAALMQVAEESIKKYGREVSLSVNDDWLQTDKPRYVHFLRSGGVSRVISLNNLQCVSVRLSLAGELLEMHSVAKLKAYADRFRVVVPGRALRLPLSVVQDVYGGDPRFRSLLLEEIGIHGAEAARTSACNIFHQIEARLASYLTKLNESWFGPLPITQEILAVELGVRRTSINLVIGDLRRRGILKLRRGSIEVMDKACLARLSCECHNLGGEATEDQNQGPANKETYTSICTAA